ncbi:MAG: superoxide dismutase family protein [Phycisphaeraceae bacterium]|nr:superoxide dismutase family protein [Phycisphaeraceae bacterium]
MKPPVMVVAMSVVALALGLAMMSARAAESAQADPWASVHELAAHVMPTTGNQCEGTVRFVKTDKGVKVIADLTGLPAGEHAIHIHEFGDCACGNGTCAGGHYNPEGKPHGLPATENRHAGDLGNLLADKDGKAHYELDVDNITLTGPRNPIIGRAVIVHEKQDDGSQPVGNAGSRLGCGTIGVAGPRKQ